MSDNTYLLILRLLHIGCGIAWAGGVIFLTFFIDPAVQRSGPEGTKFMQQLIKTNGFPVVIMLLAIITVVAGLLLIWKVSGGFQSAWLASANGIALTAGAVLAIIAFFIGLTVNRPTAMRVAGIGKAIASAGGRPTEQQLQELQMLSKKLGSASRVIAFLLILTIVGMSIFRYL